MVEKMYGEGVFYEDAVNALVPDAVPAAIEEAGLKLVARPDIDVVSVDKNDGNKYCYRLNCKAHNSRFEHEGNQFSSSHSVE